MPEEDLEEEELPVMEGAPPGYESTFRSEYGALLDDDYVWPDSDDDSDFCDEPKQNRRKRGKKNDAPQEQPAAPVRPPIILPPNRSREPLPVY